MTDAAEALPLVPPIVSAHWLQEQYNVVTVCDVRTYMDGRDGWAAYLDGHLPGARYVDLEGTLSAPAAPIVGRHPLPDPTLFAKGLGALGISNDQTVIAYDDMSGAFAGRLVWMLRALGQPAALLDGGLAAWKGVRERGQVLVDPVERDAVPWPTDVFVDADTVASHIAAGGVVADSRSAPRYRGEFEPLDAKAGHVPGAINLPFDENLNAAGRFLSPVDLQTRFADAGVDSTAIFYCGSGVTACHNLLAAEHAGLGPGKLYVGSWSGWSSDDEREVATG